MKFLPYENIKIKTKLNAEEILKRLADNVEPKRYFRWFETNHKSYEGKVEDFHFEISRAIHYRNSFLPMIKGEIQHEISGSSIRITMRPHGLVIAFMVFWLGGVGVFFLMTLAAFISTAIQGTIGNPSVLLFLAGMFAFGYLLIMGGFKFESIKSKKFFCELFEAETVEEFGLLNPFEATNV